MPSPTSPQASRPDPGPTTVTPRPRSALTLACVAGFAHMRVFMPGATMTGQLPWQARSVLVRQSSAIPQASLAITLAVAGTTIARSAHSESSMCGMGEPG